MMHKLFARTATGAIQEWLIEIEGDHYRTHHGQVGGVITTTDWTLAFPTNTGKSNARTAEEQAVFEATALWKKKQKSEDYFINIEDIDKVRFFKPMLAQQFNKRKDVQYPCAAEIKINGGRLLMQKGQSITRKGDVYTTVPHIEHALSPLFEKYPDLVLDGEAYNYELRQKLNELMSILRKKDPSPDDLKKSEEIVRYTVYDGFGFEGITKNTPFKLRRAGLMQILKDIPYVTTHEYHVAHDENEVYELYQRFIDDAEEGAIIRDLESPYEVNKRSKYLLKLKPLDDAEFIITDIEEGSGNWSGKAKIIHLKYTDSDKEFRASFKGTMDQARQCLYDKNQWINREVTIEYMGLTGLGTPNYAQFNYSLNSLVGNK